MKSLNKIQEDNLNWLGSVGVDSKSFERVNNVVSDAIEKSIETALNILQKKGTSSTRKSMDIIFEVEGSTITIGYRKDNPASQYWVFINDGVNGTRRNHGSKYSFKNEYPSKKMIKALSLWVKSNAHKARNEDQKKGKNKVQKKREALKAIDATYTVAVSVKRYGIKPNGFLTKGIKTGFNATFKKEYQKQTGIAIKEILINGNYNSK